MFWRCHLNYFDNRGLVAQFSANVRSKGVVDVSCAFNKMLLDSVYLMIGLYSWKCTEDAFKTWQL